jgi:hypothetical protein
MSFTAEAETPWLFWGSGSQATGDGKTMFGNEAKELKNERHDETCPECGFKGRGMIGILHDYCPVCGGELILIFEVVR